MESLYNGRNIPSRPFWTLKYFFKTFDFTMPPKNYTNLTVYRNQLYRNSFSFPCPHCQEQVVPKVYEKHCHHHRLDPALQCVWCYGEKRWESGQKSEHGLHLQDCFKRFIELYRPNRLRTTTASRARKFSVTAPVSIGTVSSTTPIHPESDPLPSPTLPVTESPVSVPPPLQLASLRDLCEERHFFNHSSDFLQQLPEALSSLYPLNVDSPPLPFQHESLNLAAAYVQKYLSTSQDFDWIHIVVRAVSYPSFVQAMHEDRGLTRTLDFSCWCDGGQYKLPKHRQHRHMIVVAERHHFLNSVWPHVTVTPEDKPCSWYPYKRDLVIESALHLVNTLGSLSQRLSQCRFSIDSKKGRRKKKHFYIFKRMPVCYRKVLSTLWEGGMYEYLYREKFQNVSLKRVMESPLCKFGKQWKQKMEHFYKLERGIVLPIEKRFVPTLEPTPFFLYLMKGRKLYFQSNPEHEELDQDTWLQKQAQGGNCFYDTIAEAWWTPRPRDQKILNLVMPKVERIVALEREMTHLQAYAASVMGNLTELEGRCQLQQEQYEAALRNLQLDYECLKRRYEACHKQLERCEEDLHKIQTEKK